MIQLIVGEHEIFKLDAEAGRVWIFNGNDEEPEWVEILDRPEVPKEK